MDRAETRRVIQQLSLRQNGAVSRRQLVKHGIDEGVIDRSLMDGRLVPVFAGAYMVGRRAESFRSIWMAATLAAGPTSALCGRSAAAAWGFMKPGYAVEVGRPWSGKKRFSGVRPLHRRFVVKVTRSDLLPTEIVEIGPVPVASVAATLVQLSGVLNERQLRRVFIEACRKKLLNQSNLDHARKLSAHREGALQLRNLIDLWHPQTSRIRSFLEGEFLLLCAENKVEIPLVNSMLCGKEVDCLWKHQKLIVELDSRGFHDDEFAFEDDRERQNYLTRQGYSVMRFTHLMVTSRPDAVIQELVETIRSRNEGRE